MLVAHDRFVLREQFVETKVIARDFEICNTFKSDISGGRLQG